MTNTVNGIGTYLSGERNITDEELIHWSENLPIKPYTPSPQFYMATKSFVILFLPLIPIKTFVYYYTGRESQYIICHYPAGEGKIYWKHVMETYSFYVFPAIVTLLLINSLISTLL